MTPSQRTLALALVLGAYFSCTGTPFAQPNHFANRFIVRTQVEAARLASRLETKADDILALCTPCLGGYDTLLRILDRLGIPTELVRESQ